MTVLNHIETFSAAASPAHHNADVERYPWDSFLAKSKVPQGQTDELLTWISKVNQKRRVINRQKEKDLRKVAILESVKRNAVLSLQSLQTERKMRWNQIKNQQQRLLPAAAGHLEVKEEEEDKSLCDCDACFLCIRHNGSMYGKCYCKNLFSPRPHFMKLDVAKRNSENISISYVEDEHSVKINNFLSSLHYDKSKCSSTLKRKISESSYNSQRKWRRKA